jgi:sodium-dependent dicarboxylate transporter 2/3/5
MKFSVKYPGLFLGILSFLLIFLLTDLKPGHPEVTATLAVAVLMAVWWVTEAIPLSITALVPIVLFPLLGIMNGRVVSSTYMNHIIFIFVGGFVMALAMEKWNLHKRIALKILMFVGVSPGRILFGFMLATAFLSMWISNTATAMMMIPIVLSIVVSLEDSIGKESISKYSTGLFLAIAYTASIGGMTTLVGSPTNLIMPKVLTLLYPDAPEISFADWFFFALPVTVIMIAAVWVLIYFLYRPREKWTSINREHFKEQYRNLGRMSYEEKVVFILFIILALLWIFRAGIEFDSFRIPGWSAVFGHPEYINDGTVAILISIILFIMPAKARREQSSASDQAEKPTAQGQSEKSYAQARVDEGESGSVPGQEVNARIMDWKTIRKLPWNIVLLFGGGFALAAGFQSSGLALWFGEQLSWTSSVHPLVIMFAIVTLMSFLTELTSNVASTQMLLPVFASLAVASGNNPILFMIPATLASSLAFMLPTATPPNAIIFGTDRIRIGTMVRTGFLLNMLGIIVVVLLAWISGTGYFDAQPGVLPDWLPGGGVQ